jgi:hypothetical protein
VAGHAVAELELEHAGGVDLVLDQRVAAGMGNGDRAAVGAHLAGAGSRAGRLEHGPHAARLVGSRPRPRLLGRRLRDACAGRILAAKRLEGIGRDLQQFADLLLRLVVGALAVVHREQPQLPVEEVARRPCLVLVLLPEPELRVEQHGVLDPQPRDRRADLLGILRRRIRAGVHGDDAQPGRGVALVPAADVVQRAQRVGPAEVPELDQHRPPELLVEAQRRDVDPLRLDREERGADPVGRGSHGRSG